MKWKLIVLFASVIGAVITLMIVKVPTLAISTEGTVQQFYFYEEEVEFKIRWRHSVEKEEWEEMFVLQEGEIDLTGTRFKTFGAGVPNDTGDRTFIKDGWVYMTGINQTIGKHLSLRTGEHTNHCLIYGSDEEFNLEKNKAYQISVGQHSLLNSIWYYFLVKLRGE
ncbi:protein of unknown function [Halobacillus dabanensis]|uniref:DUF1850 domain-containing protein n=1 Tax=Halobacillus dabanensis TaxID=240302 RepID=A0A1I3RTJ8_HALDA|nr:DUF1850 domain-containing protein [Halobacillus dabanensis]SFJ48651.1 protein of unknown function [Halobacillus dabanensis]